MVTASFALLDPGTLQPHEEVVEADLEELVEHIRARGVIDRPIVADAATRVVLDGHHRLAALQRLGCRLVPVHLVDYHDPGIQVDAWREDDVAPTKEVVLARASAGDLFPPKTTKHRMLRDLGRVPVRLSELA